MKNRGLLLLAAAVMVLLCITALVFKSKTADAQKETLISGARETVVEEVETETAKETVKNTTEERGDSLIIPLSEITEEANFYSVEADGTEMEIIAVRGSDGAVRTAFNTCQICYDSGRGYYVQEGKYFVCQNCGNQFTVDDIGVVSGGCNPWPILEEDRIMTEDSVEIPYNFLSDAKELFANWKVNY